MLLKKFPLGNSGKIDKIIDIKARYSGYFSELLLNIIKIILIEQKPIIEI